jgi:hypothetical protein
MQEMEIFSKGVWQNKLLLYENITNKKLIVQELLTLQFCKPCN